MKSLIAVSMIFLHMGLMGCAGTLQTLGIDQFGVPQGAEDIMDIKILGKVDLLAEIYSTLEDTERENLLNKLNTKHFEELYDRREVLIGTDSTKIPLTQPFNEWGKDDWNYEEQEISYHFALAKALHIFNDNENNKIHRNGIQSRIVAASDQRCNDFKNLLRSEKAGQNFALGSLATLAGGLGAIFTHASTVRALSGAAAILSGVRAEYNQDYYAGLAVYVISRGIDSKREEIYQNITGQQKETMEKYTMQTALRDAVKYHEACSVVVGLEAAADSIQEIEDIGLERMAKWNRKLDTINGGKIYFNGGKIYFQQPDKFRLGSTTGAAFEIQGGVPPYTYTITSVRVVGSSFSQDRLLLSVSVADNLRPTTWEIGKVIQEIRNREAKKEGRSSLPAVNVIVRVTDRSGSKDELTVEIPADTVPAFVTKTVADRTYTYPTATAIATLTLPKAAGGNGKLSYALTGSLPGGLSFDANTRTVAGKPTTVAPAVTLTYTVKDQDASTGAGDEDKLTFTVTVTPVPVILTPTALTVDEEGAMATYTVVLATNPGAEVTLTLSSDNTDVPVPGALTFSAGTWNTAQTVAVTATEDNLDYADDTATISHTVSVAPGVAIVPAVVVTVRDDDKDTPPAFGTATVADRTYTYPTATAIATLTLPKATGGNGDLSYALTDVLPGGLSFNANTRTVEGRPTTAAPAVTLTYTVKDQDANTRAVDEATLPFAVTVTPGVILTPTALTMDEGATATYTVVLATNPGAEVTLRLNSSNDDVPVPGALTFSAGTWNTAQTVAVTAAEDNLDYAGDTATISHTVSVAPGVAIVAAVVVTVTDDDTDTAPAFVTNTVADRTYTYPAATAIATLTLPEAAGGNGALRYALTGVLPGGLSFDANTRTVAGKPTTVAPAVTLTYTVKDQDASTGAGDEATLTFAVTVTPRVILTPTDLTVDEDATATYTVVLATNPSAEVTLTLSSDNTDVTVPGALTFAAGTWNTAQTVTVTVAEDTDYADDLATISHEVSVHPGFTSVTAVVVTVTDDTNTVPAFVPNTVANRTYTYPAATAIAPLTLPKATGGNGTLSYALTSGLPDGLSFDANTRTVAGTPTTENQEVTLTLTYTYTVADTDNDEATLTFTVIVTAQPAVSRDAPVPDLRPDAGASNAGG